MIRMIPQKRTDFFLEVEEIGHVSPAYRCFFKFGILKLKPPQKNDERLWPY
jgi:hypothetical protein